MKGGSNSNNQPSMEGAFQKKNLINSKLRLQIGEGEFIGIPLPCSSYLIESTLVQKHCIMSRV